MKPIMVSFILITNSLLIKIVVNTIYLVCSNIQKDDVNEVLKLIQYQTWYIENVTNHGVINIDDEFVINSNVYNIKKLGCSTRKNNETQFNETNFGII